MSDDLAAMHAYYARDDERDRLDGPVGRLEFARTIEIVQRTLPPPPATVADIGGGPGRYTDWLVAAGYSVILRDIVADHVEQVRRRHGGRVDAAQGDARALDLLDGSADAVLLLGPMYHLQSEDDRLLVLREAGRVVRAGGAVQVAAITRWATRLHGILLERFHLAHPQILQLVDEMERSGRIEPVHEASFTGFAHRPEQLRAEIVRSGLLLESLVGVEGPGYLLGDLEARLDDPGERVVLLDTLRAVERVPELLGLGPHLLATARRPTS
jgi:SAM-dependent methyltransferase